MKNRCNIYQMKDKKSHDLECQKEKDELVADQIESCAIETKKLERSLTQKHTTT